MEKLSKMGSFESFQISKKSMNQISGSRTRDFEEIDNECAKVIDTNSGEIKKVKFADRFEGRC